MTSREMPDELAELMERALAGGNVDEVSLVFEGLGSDFYAPIGWFLYLTKCERDLQASTDQDTAAANQGPEMLLATAQVHHPQVTAYLGTDPSNGKAQYWDANAIAEWITAPRDVETAGAAVAVEPAHVRMAIAAAKLGWSVSQQIRRYGHPTSSLPTDVKIPATVSYRFTADNYFYNDETSEYHRDTGAEVSMSLVLGTEDGKEGWNYALQGPNASTPR